MEVLTIGNVLLAVVCILLVWIGTTLGSLLKKLTSIDEILGTDADASQSSQSGTTPTIKGPGPKGIAKMLQRLVILA